MNVIGANSHPIQIQVKFFDHFEEFILLVLGRRSKLEGLLIQA